MENVAQKHLLEFFYHLSLLVGSSLDFEENCSLFADSLLNSEKFQGCAFWLSPAQFQTLQNALSVETQFQVYFQKSCEDVENMTLPSGVQASWLNQPYHFFDKSQIPEPLIQAKFLPDDYGLIISFSNILISGFYLSQPLTEQETELFLPLVKRFGESLKHCLEHRQLQSQMTLLKQEQSTLNEKLVQSIIVDTYALAAYSANDGFWEWDLKSDEIYFSARWKSILGYDDSDIGTHKSEWFDRIHPDDAERVRSEIASHIEELSPHFESEYRILHKDNRYHWVRTHIVAVRNNLDEPIKVVGSLTDVTQVKDNEAQLQHDAFHDLLTDLANRKLFLDRLDRAVKRSSRSMDYLYAVLLIDLDRFKLLNQSFGHEAGNQLLIDISKRMEAAARIGDTVARFGGDVFAILLEGIKSSADVIHFIERFQNIMARAFVVDNQEIFITTSIGIALSNSSYQEANDIVRDAEIAMNRAKLMGQACYEIFDKEMHLHSVSRLQVENDLRKAIENQEFILHYQPIVNLKSGKIVAFETLIRWNHPEKGLLPPSNFIEIAEETGLIIPIGEWVLETACHQVAKWQQTFEDYKELLICINVSGKQFSKADFLSDLEQVLKDSSLAPGSLKLELTESILLENDESIYLLLNEIKGLGVKLGIDDFGTGYSSLSYLHRFPIDTLKIDRSFVSYFEYETVNNTKIIETIIQLGHHLTMDIVAEGIETLNQKKVLTQLQCQYGQGFYFSKPIPVEQTQSLLEQSPHW